MQTQYHENESGDCLQSFAQGLIVAHASVVHELGLFLGSLHCGFVMNLSVEFAGAGSYAALFLQPSVAWGGRRKPQEWVFLVSLVQSKFGPEFGIRLEGNVSFDQETWTRIRESEIGQIRSSWVSGPRFCSQKRGRTYFECSLLSLLGWMDPI